MFFDFMVPKRTIAYKYSVLKLITQLPDKTETQHAVFPTIASNCKGQPVYFINLSSIPLLLTYFRTTLSFDYTQSEPKTNEERRKSEQSL
jgi:hypothetical protein